MLQAEAGSQARERALMAVAEVLSSVPPLSVPAPVQLLQASDHSMWVTWERLDRNTSGQPIDPGSVRSVSFFFFLLRFASRLFFSPLFLPPSHLRTCIAHPFPPISCSLQV